LRQDAQSLGIKGLFCVVGVQQGLSGFGAAAMQLPDLVVIAEAAHALLRQRIAISGRDAGAARTRSCVNAFPYPVAMPVQMLTPCLPIGWS
jgi:hypothetical protein